MDEAESSENHGWWGKFGWETGQILAVTSMIWALSQILDPLWDRIKSKCRGRQKKSPLAVYEG